MSGDFDPSITRFLIDWSEFFLKENLNRVLEFIKLLLLHFFNSLEHLNKELISLLRNKIGRLDIRLNKNKEPNNSPQIKVPSDNNVPQLLLGSQFTENRFSQIGLSNLTDNSRPNISFSILVVTDENWVIFLSILDLPIKHKRPSVRYVDTPKVQNLVLRQSLRVERFNENLFSLINHLDRSFL